MTKSNGTALRRLREWRGLSQADVARALASSGSGPTTRSGVNHMEKRGGTERLPLLRVLASLYRVQISDIDDLAAVSAEDDAKKILERLPVGC